MMEIRLKEIVKSILNMPMEDHGDNPAYDSLGHWSSLQHVQLVAAVEDAYSVRLSAREIRSFRTVGELRQILTTKGIVT